MSKLLLLLRERNSARNMSRREAKRRQNIDRKAQFLPVSDTTLLFVYAQVARDTMQKVEGLGGYSAVQVHPNIVVWSPIEHCQVKHGPVRPKIQMPGFTAWFHCGLIHIFHIIMLVSSGGCLLLQPYDDHRFGAGR